MEDRILVIDDEEIMRDILKKILSKQGYRVDLAESAVSARTMFAENTYDLVISDLKLCDGNGMELLKEFQRISPAINFIMITAYGTIETAIEAIKLGASDFITKPFKNEEIIRSVLVSLKKREILKENIKLKEKIKNQSSFENIIGKSKPMLLVFEQIEKVARSSTTVLIRGESGTGKELVAKAIHGRSSRALNPFVVVNTSNFPRDLIESNLFGYEKNAFTGAEKSKSGLFETANEGTIFLDEIGNIDKEIQSKLLRVIQEKEFIKLGGSKPVRVDVRILTATNENLENAIKNDMFREDLYYRLNVVSIFLPPLRERKEDIPLLISHFIEKFCKEQGKRIKGVSREVLEQFMEYDWPGNVRQLKNIIESAVLFSERDRITMDNINDKMFARRKKEIKFFPDGIFPLDFNNHIDDYKKSLIIEALRQTGGVQRKAARLLSIKPTTLNELIKRLGINIKGRIK